MSLIRVDGAGFYVECDNCGSRLPDARPTVSDAIEYARNAGWYASIARHICSQCLDKRKETEVST